jgi:hypothetical protein
VKRLFVFLPILLFATVNEPLRLELLSGYRNDSIHWHVEGDGSTYSEKYSGVQFWENELALRSIHRDIVFYARGGYSAFGAGTMKQTPSEVQVSTSGWALDGVSHFGYAVNLTPDRLYKAMVIPLVGFSGHYEQLHRSGLPKYYQQTWYGPYIGGAIRVEPGNGLLFEVGYSYNWFHLRATDQYVLNDVLCKMKFKGWGNHGHSGWAQMDFQLNRAWNLGLFGQIDYDYSNVHNVTVNQGGVDTPQQFKLRWTPVSGMVFISRQIYTTTGHKL